MQGILLIIFFVVAVVVILLEHGKGTLITWLGVAPMVIYGIVLVCKAFFTKK